MELSVLRKPLSKRKACAIAYSAIRRSLAFTSLSMMRRISRSRVHVALTPAELAPYHTCEAVNHFIVHFARQPDGLRRSAVRTSMSFARARR